MTGNLIVVLSYNEVHGKRNEREYTKREVQIHSKSIFKKIHKTELIRLIIMTEEYTGIEQVNAELDVSEERNTYEEIGKVIGNLGIIYMRYPMVNSWERINLFIMLQQDYNEILLGCMLSDHIRNLAGTRRGLVSAIQISNFQVHLKEGSNTIAISQETHLKEFE
jgi:hypothetical protein